MRFHCGSSIYRLKIAPGKLYSSGVECLGACLESSREILISADCPPDQRIGIIARQLLTAWRFEVGTPAGAADWADLAASVITGMLRDLTTCGGPEAICRLKAGESPEEGTARVTLTRNRQCGVCDATVAGCSVVCRHTGTPGILRLSLYCEFCGHVQVWSEAATVSGLPSGTVVEDARFERGQAVQEFLTANPEAAGVA